VPAARLPANEPERLRDLRRYEVLDTPPDAGLDALTQLAKQIAGTPIALISLTDESRQWFKSRVGLDVLEIPRDWAPCAHAVATGENIVCHDMREDERFADNPLVRSPPHLRFYAGMVLLTPRGTVLGTLAVIDTEPRTLSLFQQNALALIARQIVDQLELRTAYRELATLRVQEQSFEARLWREKADEAQRLAAELHDGVGQELAGISLLIGAALQQAREGDLPLALSLEEINRLLTSTINTCRSTAEEHGGFLVRKEGLVGALARVMERLDQGGGARFALDRPGLPIECLDELTAYHLYRVVGEAIANAHRHSGAKRIGVRSFHGDGKVIFEVEDDGAGNKRRAAVGDGIGKSVMEYRARAIGAQLEFAERASGGVSVRCALPCGCARRSETQGTTRTGT
jgi:signal transduction histidine kinase